MGQCHTVESEVKVEATTTSTPLLVQEGLRLRTIARGLPLRQSVTAARQCHPLPEASCEGMGKDRNSTGQRRGLGAGPGKLLGLTHKP